MLERGSGWRREDYLRAACAGGFLEPAQRPAGRARSAWWRDYADRLLRRDAAEQAHLAHLDRLPGLLRLLAARHTQELVVDRLAAEVNLSPRTLPSYLDLLSRLYLLHLLPPWSANLGRREVDRRRVYLADSGLVAFLLGLTPSRLAPGRDPQHTGALLEGFAVEQLRRQIWWSKHEIRLFHYRDYSQREVDLVAETPDGRVAAIEVKARSSFGERDVRHLRWFAERLGDRFAAGVLLHTGQQAVPLGPRIAALPIAAIWSG
jgi:predicted AAA+ superfamily ATPase